MQAGTLEQFPVRHRLELLSVASGVTAMLVGGLVLFGWALGIESIKRVYPGFVSMNPVTAIALILSGLALCLFYRPSGERNPDITAFGHRVAWICVVLVVAIGLLVGGDFIFAWDLEIDRLLFPGMLAGDFSSGDNHMAPTTAATFILLGLALATLDFTTRHGFRPAEYLAWAVAFISVIRLVGYGYSLGQLVGSTEFVPMAFHTAVIFGLLAFGVLAARPEVGFMALVTGKSLGGMLLTRIFPAMAVAVAALGWLSYRGEVLGFYSGPTGVVMNVLANVGIIWILLGGGAVYLRKQGLQRRQLKVERQRFFDLSAELICVVNRDGYLREANAAFMSALGYTEQELKFRPLVEFIHPDDLQASLVELDLFRDGQGSTYFVNRIGCKDGSYKTLSWSLRAFPDEGVTYGSARDVTELVTIQEALHTREEELSTTLWCIGEGVVATDVKGRITRFNLMAESLTGWKESEAVGLPLTTVFRIIDEKTRQRATVPIAETLASGAVRELSNHMLLVSRDGQERPIADSCAPIRNAGGTIVGAVLTFRDVSEERCRARELERAYATARAERARLKTVLDTVVEGIISIDEAGIVETFNPGAERLFGYKADEVVGQHVKLLIPKPYGDEHDADHKDHQGIGRRKIVGIYREVLGRRKDGSMFPVELAVGETVSGNERHYTGMVRDLSERDRLVSELEAARMRADDANAAKSEFLAAMSHEIRTPMNGVIGMLDVLHQTSLKGYQVEMLGLIQESADSLLTIINEILDFSKIEAGAMKVHRAGFDVATMVENTCVILDRLAEKQHVVLMVFVDPSIPSILDGDEQLLRQILINLVNNAIKFSSKQGHPGRVSVRVGCSSRDEHQLMLEFRVRDNGIGMDQNTLDNLFRPFMQATVSTSRRFGGTGLGLSISHNLVQLMGGAIEAESEPGKGSTFTFRVPFESPAEVVSNQPVCADAAGLSCIVVGDSRGLAPDIAVYLAHAGARVDKVESLELARESMRCQSGGVWVLIIDAEDAHPTVAELESAIIPEWNPETPLLAVLVERGRRHNVRRKAEGVFVVDGNALRRKTLLQAVALAAGRGGAGEPADAEQEARYEGKGSLFSRETARRLGRLILVAEDNETNQKVIVQQLALLGIAADVAADGRDAIERWRTYDYPLLLTDLHMPNMDGYQLAEAIRAEEGESAHMGIIALTANAASGEIQRCLDIGMDDYLSKPARLEDIEKLLNNWLPPLAAQPQDLTQADRETQAPPVSCAMQHSGGDPVDVSVLLNFVDDDPEILRQLLKDFQHSAARISEELRVAWASGTLSGVGAAAHKLKSSARTVGAMMLGDVCEQIEAAVKRDDAETVENLVPTFEGAQAAVDQYLETY